MIYDYTCTNNHPKNNSWKGQVHLLKSSNPYELKVTARHSCFHVICGTYVYGNYLCIPSLGIGSEIAGLTDTFWNLERLTMNNPKLSKVDAISIIYAIKALSQYITI